MPTISMFYGILVSMYFMDTSEPLLPKVTKVQVLDDFELLLEFTDGVVKRFDVKPYLHFPAFGRLKQGGLFAKAHVANGTVVWDDRLDLAPETLYLKGRDSVEVGAGHQIL